MTRNALKAGLLSFLLVVSVVAGAGALSSGVLAADGSDGNDTRANATAMDADSTVSGTIESGDVDWYAVEIEAGQGIYGQLSITTANDENLRFDVFSPDGEKINRYPNDALGPAYQTKRLVAGDTTMGGTLAEQSGTHYIRVKSADDSVSEATSYDLTVTSVSIDENDPNEQPAQATALDIENNETVSGVLTGYDRDTYAIDLQKGETVTVSHEQSNGFTLYTYLATPNASDAMLNPYYKGEYAVAGEPIGGPDEFDYTANTSGTYYIRMVPYVEGSTIGTFNEKVSYEMSVSVSDSDDTDSKADTDGDDSRTNATMIDVGETVNSTLAVENDSDWYAVDLEKGQGFIAQLIHENREDPGAELTFDLYAPGGERIGEYPFDAPLNAYSTSPGSNIAYGGDVVEQSGTYYIRVQGIEGANYSLTTDTVALDEYDPNEQPAQATTIESGDTTSAKLTGYDRDVYAIDVQKGDTVTIDFTQSDGFTTALYVADPTVPSPMHEDYTFEENVSVAEIDPFSDSPATFTANRTGTYYIKVVPYFESSTASTFFQNVTYEMSVSVSDPSGDEDGKADDTDDRDSNEVGTPEDDAEAESDGTPPDTDTDESEQTADEEGDRASDDADDRPDEMMGDTNADTSDEEQETDEERDEADDTVEDTDETVTETGSERDDEEQTTTPETDCPEETIEDDSDCDSVGHTS